MAELYWGTTSDFIDQATRNQIADTLREAFFAYYGYPPSPSEQRPWRSSLAKLATALNHRGFLDHGLFLEFQIPLTSKRIDALVTGRGHDDRADAPPEAG